MIVPRHAERIGQGRAYGKAILLGEHAVVYGAPALVVGIAPGLHAEAWELGEGGSSRLELFGQSWPADSEGPHLLSKALAALLAEGPRPPPEVAVHLDEALPAGVGLGFSAAAGVALARAVEGLRRALAAADATAAEQDEEAVRQRATAWERVFHGNPSGVDVAAAMHGGLLRFRRGQAPGWLELGGGFELCVGRSGTRSSTREMVARLAERRRRDRRGVDEAVARIAALVAQAEVALRDGDLRALGTAMDRNHELLASLELSTEALDRMCALARRAGALGAKLTGAGGGGAVVAVVDSAAVRGARAEAQPLAEQVLGAWKEQGCEGFSVSVGPTDRRAQGAGP